MITSFRHKGLQLFFETSSKVAIQPAHAARLHILLTALNVVISAVDMALRLRDALGTSAELWINMQAQYDLWQAEKKPRPAVISFREPVQA